MDTQKADSVLKSALIGRIAGAILFITAMALQYYGYDVSAEDQKAVVDGISALSGSIGTILVIISKVRESKKQ